MRLYYLKKRLFRLIRLVLIGFLKEIGIQNFFTLLPWLGIGEIVFWILRILKGIGFMMVLLFNKWLKIFLYLSFVRIIIVLRSRIMADFLLFHSQIGTLFMGLCQCRRSKIPYFQWVVLELRVHMVCMLYSFKGSGRLLVSLFVRWYWIFFRVQTKSKGLTKLLFLESLRLNTLSWSSIFALLAFAMWFIRW